MQGFRFSLDCLPRSFWYKVNHWQTVDKKTTKRRVNSREPLRKYCGIMMSIVLLGFDVPKVQKAHPRTTEIPPEFFFKGSVKPFLVFLFIIIED